jgi:nucleoside-diphosphate-sugar epimerase
VALTDAVRSSTALVHAAGLIRAARATMYDAVNVDGTRAAVAAANAAGSRLILISSLAAAGPGTPGRPRQETEEPHPLTAYGWSKLNAELVVRSVARGAWTIIRPSAVYGPRDRGFLPLFRLAARGLFLLVADPNTAFTMIHIDDLARGTVLAATDDRAIGETLFFGHPRPQTAEDVLRGLARAFGRAYRPIRVPTVLLRGAAYAGELSWLAHRQPIVDKDRMRELMAGGFVCSVDRAYSVLGFTAGIDWQEGAEQTARWYDAQGWV